MDEEDKNIRLAVAVHQNAGAHVRHVNWSTLRKTRNDPQGAGRLTSSRSKSYSPASTSWPVRRAAVEQVEEWHLARNCSLDLHQRRLTEGGK
jgi:hypothetical protein